jgi:hypothetical protein
LRFCPMTMAWFSAAFFFVLFTSFTVTVIQIYSPSYLNTSLDHSQLY